MWTISWSPPTGIQQVHNAWQQLYFRKSGFNPHFCEPMPSPCLFSISYPLFYFPSLFLSCLPLFVRKWPKVQLVLKSAEASHSPSQKLHTRLQISTMHLMTSCHSRLTISVCHQVAIIVDGLPVILDRNSLIVTMKTTYIFWMHERRGKTIEIWTEFQVMFGVCTCHQYT